MAIALTVLNAPNGDDNTQRRQVIYGTATVSGSYTTGGETINWLTLSSTSGGKVLIETLQTAPAFVEFQMGQPGTGTPTNLFPTYNYTTGKVQFWIAAGTEFPAGAYTANVYTNAIFRFKAEFPREV